MSFQLGSEPLLALVESNYRLTPMSIQLGSELPFLPVLSC